MLHTAMLAVLGVGVLWLLVSLVFDEIVDHLGTGFGLALVAFGGLGLVLPWWVALPAGLLAWGTVGAIEKQLRKSETGPLPGTEILTGRTITISKPSDPQGRNATSLVTFRGTSAELLVSSEQGTPLRRGDSVWVTRIDGNRATVRKNELDLDDYDWPQISQ